MGGDGEEGACYIAYHSPASLHHTLDFFHTWQGNFYRVRMPPPCHLCLHSATPRPAAALFLAAVLPHSTILTVKKCCVLYRRRYLTAARLWARCCAVAGLGRCSQQRVSKSEWCPRRAFEVPV